MISSLLHLDGLRPRVYYTLTNFRGGGKAPLPPPPLNTPMNGVQQGGVISPLLFSLYIDELFLLLKQSGLVLTKKRITLFDKKITMQKKSKLAHLRLLSNSNRL